MAIGPNPTAREVPIRFSLAHRAEVELEVYDVAGRRARVLTPGVLEAGLHTIRWDGRGETGQLLGSGVYFCRFREANRANTFKIVRIATR